MINRVLIRTRALQVAYAHYRNEGVSLGQVEKDYRLSLERTHALYLYLLRLIPSLTHLLEEQQQIRSCKRYATAEERKPNTKLVGNLLAKQIEECVELETWYSNFGLSWEEDNSPLKHLLSCIEDSQLYREYLKTERSYEGDRAFWCDALRHIIAPNSELGEYLEWHSVYWGNDLVYIERISCENFPVIEQLESIIDEAKAGVDSYSSQPLAQGVVELVKEFAGKSLKKASEDVPFVDVMLPLFFNPDDEAYAFQLVRQLFLKREEYFALLAGHNQTKWDNDRLTDIDVILVLLGLVEFLHFPSIQTQVTINEYVELAKHYSTPRSASFVNGLLDSMARSLKEEKKILKQ